MKNQRGFIHIVAVVAITLVAVLMVGAAWYVEENRDGESTVVAVIDINASQVDDITAWKSISYDTTVDTFTLDIPKDWEVINQPLHDKERLPFMMRKGM